MSTFELYLTLGFEHILDWNGYDHMLFIAALSVLFPLKEWKKFFWIITGFTFGHSIALALATLEWVSISPTIIEFLIPITILITALIALFTKTTRFSTLSIVLVIFFGIIHGLGFSNYLRQLLMAEKSLFIPLLGFNLGLEIGQIIILFILLGIIYVLEKLFHVEHLLIRRIVSILVLLFTAPLLFRN